MLIKPSGSTNTVDKGTVRGRRYGVRRTHWTRRSWFYVFWWQMSGFSVLTSLYSYIVSSICLRDHRRSVKSTYPFWRYVQTFRKQWRVTTIVLFLIFVDRTFIFVSWCIIIVIIFIVFMQNIDNYMSATNHVSTVYSVATVLYYSLCYLWCYFTCWIFCTFILALPEICV